MTNGNTAITRFFKKRVDLLFKTNKDNAHVIMLAHEVKRSVYGYDRTVVPAHAVDGDSNSHPGKGHR